MATQLRRLLLPFILSALLGLAVACSSAPAPTAPATSVPSAPTADKPAAAPAPAPTRAPTSPAVAVAPTIAPTSVPSLASKPLDPALAARLEPIFSRTAAIRGLPVKAKVPLGTMDRSQLRPYLVSLLEKDHAKEDMEKDRAVMVMLDLLKDTDDLYELWLGLLDEQILGLYDFDAKEMRLIGVGSQLKPMDEVALSHEYVHALQDQSFDLGAKTKKLKGDSEKLGALQALTEGDATLAMTVYAQKHLTKEQLADLSQQGAGTSAEKLKSAPLMLRLSLLFPYEQGAIFATALAQSGGWPAVDKAYSNLPATTEQILHPQKYVAAEGAKAVDLSKASSALGSDWSVFREDSLGELGVYAYLANGIDAGRAQKAAAGWGGDRMTLYQNGKDRALVVALAWDTPQDATEFMTALRDLCQARGGYTGSDPNHISWTSSGRGGYATTNGDRSMLAVTTSDSAMKKLMPALTVD